MGDEKEYVIFNVESSTGETVEMAVLYEFEFENKYYVAAGLVEGDCINEDGVYIYRVKNADSDDFTVEKINNKVDYEKVVKAYMEMVEDEEEE